MNDAITIKQRYEHDWMAIPEVVAIGVGKVENSTIGIIISVIGDVDSVRKQLPELIDGVIIRVQRSGILRTT
jgi:hypothetical protein